MSTYGQKGGEGPTRGKKAIKFRVVLPDGTVLIKRIFAKTRWGGQLADAGDTLIATGFMYDGKPSVAVWVGEPAWEGEFGRLVATRI